jgi:3-oxoacyl-(acyl-carrier-protein) synthase
VGLLTGWGEGVEALAGCPEAWEGEAPAVVPVPAPDLTGERLRRATRECRLAVAAARAAVRDAGVPDGAVAGPRTGLLFVSATSHAAANRAFLLDEGAGTLHFPYTSPSAIPGEVTIDLGIRGPYILLMGGATATLQGVWYAARWLAEGAADRVLVLAVEAVQEVADLFTRARRLHRGPLVEGAGCLLMDRDEGSRLAWASGTARGRRVAGVVAQVLDAVTSVMGAGRPRPGLVATAASLGAVARAEATALAERGLGTTLAVDRRLGEMLTLGPLVAMARACRLATPRPWLLTGAWQDDYGALLYGGRTDGRAGDRG